MRGKKRAGNTQQPARISSKSRVFLSPSGDRNTHWRTRARVYICMRVWRVSNRSAIDNSLAHFFHPSRSPRAREDTHTGAQRCCRRLIEGLSGRFSRSPMQPMWHSVPLLCSRARSLAQGCTRLVYQRVLRYAVPFTRLPFLVSHTIDASTHTHI